MGSIIRDVLSDSFENIGSMESVESEAQDRKFKKEKILNIIEKYKNGEITEFSDVKDIPGSRLLNVSSSEEWAKASMYYYLHDTIEYLCESPYCSRERIMETQYNIVVAILSAYLRGMSAFILEAPTGVGKSIIGIIVSETLRKYIGGNQFTYFLTSSKMLQDQMERDTSHFNLHYAVLKGQANYKCLQNGKTFMERECSDFSIPKATEQMPCSKNCGYIQARIKAMTWYGAIMSYAYWLSSMNFVYEKAGDYAPFGIRPLTIFDECHMLSDVVQGMFQQEINSSLIKRFTLLHDLLLQCNIDEKVITWSLSEIEQIKTKIVELIDERISVNDMFIHLKELCDMVGKYTKVIIGVCNKYLPNDTAIWIAPQKRLDNLSETLHKWWLSMRYFVQENEDNMEFIVKTYSKDKLGNVTMTLRTLKEQDLIKRHVHKYCQFSIFMSATIGDADVFAENNGIENYETMYIESQFEYAKSPIYIVNPPISMAMKQKTQNMKELLYRIVHLSEEHGQERGIIHTGNFEIARNLKEFIWEHSNNPRRFLFYNDAFQKAEAIKKLQKNKNAIIVGPSLMEGLDLKDDLCRFMILAKVPYPTLDEFNSKKMKLMPDWYGWKTTTTIIQGLGRGIRHKTDWCVTYLMDSCFSLIFQKQRIPRYITSRITSINVGRIEQKMLELMDEADGLFNYRTQGVDAVKPKDETYKETVDTIDVESMLKEGTTNTTAEDDKEEWDDLPF